MLDSIDIKFTVSVFLFLTFPISSAYHQALRLAGISRKQHILFGLMAMFASALSISFGLILIAQIDERYFSPLNLLLVPFTFIFSVIIRKKFPDLFLKLLFNRSN